MQLDKLTNQVRFIQMIIKKELVVSGRKKQDIVRDLKTKGFVPYEKAAKVTANAEAENENAAAEDEEEEDTSTSGTGYDYLLQVSFGSLIMLIVRCQSIISLRRKWRGYKPKEATRSMNSTSF